MKKFAFFLLIFCLSAVSLFSQNDEFYSTGEKEQQDNQRKTVLEKWSFGGSFWLSFGSITYIEISPVALYTATPRLSIGPGFTYRYQKYKEYNFETSSYGPRGILMFTLLKDLKKSINLNLGNIIFYAEDEFINIEDYNSPDEDRLWINNLLIGGGIFQPLGSKSGGISFLILWDVSQNMYSPYSNPEIRFGFYF